PTPHWWGPEPCDFGSLPPLGHALPGEAARLGTGADSVKAFSAVLHKKPNDAEALAALEALLKDESVRAEAARALIPAYEAVKEHRKLVAALDLVAEMTQDQPDRV